MKAELESIIKGEIDKIDLDKIDLKNDDDKLVYELIKLLLQQREYLENLTNGNLSYKPASGYNALLAPVKDLHSNLNHILWQLKNISEGHYGTKSDFLGDFAETFDLFVQEMAKRESLQLEHNEFLQKQLKLQVNHYKQINEVYDAMRGMKHDLKNHCFILNEFLKTEQYQEAINFLESFASKAMIEDNLIIHTNNVVLDALMNEKLSVAKSKGIDTLVNIAVQRKLKIDTIDWCMLVGNIMDNAIEACEKIKSVKKEIRIKAVSKNSFFSINVVNSAFRPIVSNAGLFKTTKPQKMMHGLGMKNMQEVVDKYDGVMTTDFKDGFFAVNVMLCNV